MLTVAVLLPLLAAASLSEPLDSALGFDFDVAVSEQSVAAALGNPDLPRLPDNLDIQQIDSAEGTAAGWHYLVPGRLPDRLNRADTRVIGLLTEQRVPARLVVQVPVRGCEDLFIWLNDSLMRKYGVEGEPDIPARAPHLKATRYTQGDRQIDVACGPDLQLQYTDLSTLSRWREEQVLQAQLRQQHLQAREQAVREIAEANARAFADQFTLGDRARLQGGFGVVFNQPFTAVEAFTADKPFPVELADLPAPFDAGSFEIELDPDGNPIEVAADITDPALEHFDAIVEALSAKFGAPIKDSRQHKIFRINGNFFVVRALARTSTTRVSLLDGQARRAQREREKAREAAELAAIEAAFRNETDGL